MNKVPEAACAQSGLNEREAQMVRSDGLTTGNESVDTATGGLARGEFTILGGRPSSGKTTLALAIAAEIARQGEGVAWFSLELPSSDFALRLLALESAIPASDLLAGRFNAEAGLRLEAATTEVGRWPAFVIDDTPGQSVESIAAAVHELAARTDLALVVIDYLQLVGTQGAHETWSAEFTDVCARLRALARAADVAMLVTSQLSRALEVRTDRRPRLTDLGPGAVAEHADAVLLLDASEEGAPRLRVAKHPRVAPVELGQVRW